jgi:hypothetical protein
MNKTLSPADLREIRRQADQGFSNLYIAKRFGISGQAVSQIKAGRWLNSQGASEIKGLK